MNPALGYTNYKIWSPKRSIATMDFNYTGNDLERGATRLLSFHRKWTWFLSTVGHSYEVFCTGGVENKNIRIFTSCAILCLPHWWEANHNTLQIHTVIGFLLSLQLVIDFLSSWHMQKIVNKPWDQKKNTAVRSTKNDAIRDLLGVGYLY